MKTNQILEKIKELDWYDKIKPDEVVFDEQQCDRSNELYTTIISMPKRQQWHWNKGHKVNTRKLYLSLNATMLTLKFLTNEAKKEFLKETQKEHEND